MPNNQATTTGLNALKGKRVLIVEDEYFIGADMAKRLEIAGVEVLGPAATCSEGRDLLNEDPIDAAILDILLSDGTVYPLAAELQQSGIPFMFLTGVGEVPEEFASAPRIEKPCSELRVLAVLAKLVGRH